MTGKNLSLIQVANMENVYWPVRPSNRRGCGKEVDGGNRYFFHFIREVGKSVVRSKQ